MRGAALVFAAFFGLYVWNMPPGLPLYRDSGEMTTSAATLGVSHPTGYPLYILLGHAIQVLPLGNRAYRMDLLSAAAGAAALSLLFFICRRRLGVVSALGAAILLGLNPTYWSVCMVPEMYSLWMLASVAVLALAWRLREGYGERLWLGFCFLYGLALTNRMDLVLWAPGLLWMALGPEEDASRVKGLWAMLALACFPAALALTDSKALLALLIVGTALWRAPAGRKGRWALWSLAFAGLGLSLDLYLPIRSSAHPWLDWNHPAELANLKETLLRSRYGGTLDLLSKSYAKGELLVPNLVVYGRHLWDSFSLVGLLAAVLGCASLSRSDNRIFLGAAAAYWWGGPLFLFLANMPPNPHALAIVEPHYLPSDLILALWAAFGLSALAGGRGAQWRGVEAGGPAVPGGFRKGVAARRAAWGRQALACLAVLALAVVPFSRGLAGRMGRRQHLFSYDYAKNVLRCVPPGGVLVAKKDVQLYSLWHYQALHGWRPDVDVVAQGLAGSPWYREGWRRRDPGLALSPLRDAAQWARFIGSNPAVFALPDAEVPPEIRPRRQNGMASALGPAASRGVPMGRPWDLFVLRGDYRYDTQPDFFTSDIVSDYSRALYFEAEEASKAGEALAASALLNRSWSMHWMFPEAPTLLGYVVFSSGAPAEAKPYYEAAVALYDEMLRLAEEYRALPELKGSISRGAAEAMMHLGVLCEKTGDPAAAERRYLESLRLHPLAQTHFNLAVLYWDKDWTRVRRELTAALSLDPTHADAAKYHAMLRGRPR
ncbi:MAG: DUF2723 domain-containing protein [Elusimicrobia bacterium]|nr:DUF2723 domain-containing protein [Elusimicrobiota bacterium]